MEFSGNVQLWDTLAELLVLLGDSKALCESCRVSSPSPPSCCSDHDPGGLGGEGSHSVSEVVGVRGGESGPEVVVEEEELRCRVIEISGVSHGVFGGGAVPGNSNRHGGCAKLDPTPLPAVLGISG